MSCDDAHGLPDDDVGDGAGHRARVVEARDHRALSPLGIRATGLSWNRLPFG